MVHGAQLPKLRHGNFWPADFSACPGSAFSDETPLMLARTLNRVVAGLLPARAGKNTAPTTAFHHKLGDLCGVSAEQLSEYAMIPVEALVGAEQLLGYFRLCQLAAPVAAVARRAVFDGIADAVAEEVHLGRRLTGAEQDRLRDKRQTESKTLAVDLVHEDITLLKDWTSLKEGSAKN